MKFSNRLWMPIMRFRSAADFTGPAMRRAVPVLFSMLVACGLAFAQQPAKPKAAAPQSAKPNAAENSKCIAVLSAIGENLVLKKIGITVFGNEETTAPIDSWHIDDLVVSKISGFLAKRWTVRRIDYPKGTFAFLEEQHSLFHNVGDDVVGALRRLTSSAPCDYYVVVLKTGHVLFNTNQTVYGLGILETSALLTPSDHIHALFKITVYDGRTFAPLGAKSAFLGGRTFIDEITQINIHGPFRAVDRSWWPQSDAGQSSKLRDGIRLLISQGLDATMPEILSVQ
jgi:hypothetical protein